MWGAAKRISSFIRKIKMRFQGLPDDKYTKEREYRGIIAELKGEHGVGDGKPAAPVKPLPPRSGVLADLHYLTNNRFDT
jgi:hypothetical protein